MSAGIYMNNGILAYSMDLEKKLKRRKQAVIIEVYKGDNPTEEELQKMLDKHNKRTAPEAKIVEEDRPLKYRWKHVSNGQTITSIYDNLNHIPNIKKEEWIPIE